MNKRFSLLGGMALLTALSLASCTSGPITGESQPSSLFSSESHHSSSESSEIRNSSGDSSSLASSETASSSNGQHSSSESSSSGESSGSSSSSAEASSSEISSESEDVSSSESPSSSEIQIYQITWMNWDGSVLLTSDVEEGETPSYTGETPSKQSNAQYTYAFSGWSPEIAPAYSSATYLAQFTETTNTFVVTWKNHDGKILEIDNDVPYGTLPSYDGTTPSKGKTAQYTYVFSGWDKDLAPVTEDVTYFAQFEEETNVYTVTFKDWDGSFLYAQEYGYGSLPSYQGDAPTRGSTAQFSYVFSGWSPEIKEVTKDVTYTALYTQKLRSYNVTWKNYDGEVLLSEQCSYGKTPSYGGETPSKPSSAQFSYEFIGWDSEESGPIESDRVYTAKYKETTNEYAITWKDYDGNVLRVDSVPYGETPSYGEIPTRSPDRYDSYAFSGWDPEVASVASDMTYTAAYTKSPSAEYTISFDANGGYGAPSSVSKTPGNSILLPVSKPSRSGYVFLGWNSIYEDKVYENGDSFSSDMNVTFFAMWLPECAACEGSGKTVSSYSTCSTCDGSGEIVTVTSNSRRVSTCGRCGGTGKLANYSTCSKCSGKRYARSSGPEFESIGEREIVLKAVEGYEYSMDGENWQLSPIFDGFKPDTECSFYQRRATSGNVPFGPTSEASSTSTLEGSKFFIAYELNGGENAEANPSEAIGNITFANPSKRGYRFLRWDVSYYRGSPVVSQGDALELNVNQDITLTAVWGDAIEYTITYDLNGGTLETENPSKYTIESDDVTFGSPSREGYTFEGWSDGSTDVASIPSGSTGDLSLTARWSANKYVLSVINSDESKGSVSVVGEGYTDETIEVTATPETGCVFVGWYSNDKLVSSGNPYTFSMPFSDYSLEARWKATKQNISVSTKGEGTLSVTGNGYTGESITATATPADGFAFDGWYNGENLVSEANSYTFIMPSNDLALEARFTMTPEEEARRKALGIDPVIDSENNTLTYGLYPQTHVSDSVTIASLNALASAESNGWYLLNGEYYAKKETDPYRSYYVFDDGETIVEGTTYWFKCEPITWKILSSSDGEYSLVSTLLLDAHRYNGYYSGTDENGYYANNYENSEIRKWLNDDFYKSAFSLGNSLIQTTTVDNSASTTDSSSNSYARSSTEDNVYLLNYQDYLNADYGFSTSSSTCDTVRQCEIPDWARANGAEYSLSYPYNGYYWTRSPASSAGIFVWSVDYLGRLNDSNLYYSFASVRPAITIKLTQKGNW